MWLRLDAYRPPHRLPSLLLHQRIAGLWYSLSFQMCLGTQTLHSRAGCERTFYALNHFSSILHHLVLVTWDILCSHDWPEFSTSFAWRCPVWKFLIYTTTHCFWPLFDSTWDSLSARWPLPLSVDMPIEPSPPCPLPPLLLIWGLYLPLLGIYMCSMLAEVSMCRNLVHVLSQVCNSPQAIDEG